MYTHSGPFHNSKHSIKERLWGHLYSCALQTPQLVWCGIYFNRAGSSCFPRPWPTSYHLDWAAETFGISATQHNVLPAPPDSIRECQHVSCQQYVKISKLCMHCMWGNAILGSCLPHCSSLHVLAWNVCFSKVRQKDLQPLTGYNVARASATCGTTVRETWSCMVFNTDAAIFIASLPDRGVSGSALTDVKTAVHTADMD